MALFAIENLDKVQARRRLPSFRKCLRISDMGAPEASLEPKEVDGPYSPSGFRHGNQTNAENFMSVGTIILIILVIALLGGFSGIGGGPFYGTGYYGGGGLGLVIIILLILLLLGKL